jgi:hypothetical protein
LLLSDFTGATFDRDALGTMKESAVFDTSFVKKSTLIGIENFPREFEELTRYSRRELRIFKTPRESFGRRVGYSASERLAIT